MSLLTTLEAAPTADALAPEEDVLARIRQIASDALAPIVTEIDLDGRYPEEVLRQVGAAGGFAQHLASSGDMAAAIDVMAVLGEQCLSTAFLGWCQNACAWYLENTENAALREALSPAVASAHELGGTALSNPMKTLSGIESLLLRGERVDGGYWVSGNLPWVSNLGPDHVFGAVFRAGDKADGQSVMALLRCEAPGLELRQVHRFTALEGTRTFSVGCRDLYVPDGWVLAAPAEPFLRKIRPGFILLQTGMALGLVRGCIEIMRRAGRSTHHVNGFLPVQPDEIEKRLEALTARVHALAVTPRETDRNFMRHVLTARLACSELSLEAAQAAMLHAGARGYVQTAPAQRRLRESYFVAIVTPAIKHLRKELAALDRINGSAPTTS